MRLRLAIAAMFAALPACTSSTISYVSPGSIGEPSVSGVAAAAAGVAFELSAPAHVAAIEVVTGEHVQAIAPRDLSGPVAAGRHTMPFQAIATTRAPDPAARTSASRVVQSVAYEPCPGEPPVRYEPATVNEGRSGERAMVRQEQRYCPAPASPQPIAEPPATRWLIVIASETPIDLEQFGANLAGVGSTGFAPEMLATVAATAMASHKGMWSASATRR